MTGPLIDTAGWIGAAALLVAYGLVSSGRLNGRSIRFQLLNLTGAAGLLANGIWHGAWPSAALNAIWLVIGITAVMRRSNPSPVLDEPALAAAAAASRANEPPSESGHERTTP
jgi:hypothetical protein